jgi:hypothetical protein
MELYVIVEAVLLAVGNLAMKISINSPMQLRIVYVLCLYLLIFPIISQLWHRRIKKTIIILFTVFITAMSFIGICLSFFISIPTLYLTCLWALFFFARFIQDTSICYHCSQMKISCKPSGFRTGMYLMIFSLLVEVAVVAAIIFIALNILTVRLPVITSIGLIGYAFGVLGVLILRLACEMPIHEEAILR